jgi:hypothetical protein
VRATAKKIFIERRSTVNFLIMTDGTIHEAHSRKDCLAQDFEGNH